MSLRTKMLALLLAPVIVLVALLSYYAYFTAREGLKEQILQTDESITQYYSETIYRDLLKHEMVVSDLASIAGHHNLTPDEIKEFVKFPLDPKNGIRTLCMAFENKFYVDSDGWQPPADYDHRTRDWYKKIMASNGEVVYSDPYIDKATNKMLVIAGKPIIANGKKIGVVTSSVILDDLMTKIKDTKLGKSGYIFVVSRKGELISHPEFKPNETLQTVYDGKLQGFYQKALEGKHTTEVVTINNNELLYGATPVPGAAGWFMGSVADTDELFSRVNNMAYMLMVGCVLVVIVLSIVIFWVTMKITRSLQAMMQQSLEMAAGDFRDSKQLVTSNDEIGKLAEALSEMKKKLRTLLGRVSASAEHLASSSEELTASTDQSSQASNQVATSITSVAQGAEKQLQSVAQTSDIVNRITEDITRLADSSNIIADKTIEAAQKTNSGKAVVDNVISQMTAIETSVTTSAQLVGSLGERSREIGQIVDTISGIAGQTNLLALNAAIEAARAGEQGRGFAVVAEEVRKLAEESQSAAKHISELISRIQADTEQAVLSMDEEKKEVAMGTEVVHETKQTFEEIDIAIEEVRRMAEQVRSATEQIATGSKDLESEFSRIDSVSKHTASETETISAATEEQAASMEEMASASQTLAKLAQEMQADVAKFKV